MVAEKAVGTQRLVLIVDGEPTFGGTLEQQFLKRSFRVCRAHGLDDALKELHHSAPEIILVDPNMAGGGALTLVREAKALTPAPLVVLVSGSPSLPVALAALKEGASTLFSRPFDIAAMIDTLEGHSHLSPANHLSAAALSTAGIDCFFSVSPGLLSVAGFDGYFKMLHPAWEKLTGYSAAELCAVPYAEFLHPDDRLNAKDESVDVSATGDTVFCFRNRFRCKDGTYRHLAWSAALSPHHQLIYSSARDVTKHVRMESGLRKTNEALARDVSEGVIELNASKLRHERQVQLAHFKDDLSAMIVHDLKGPLSVIVTNYDFIIDAFEGSGECVEALKDSRVAGQRMLRLLAELTDVARLEKGALTLKRTPVSLPGIAQSIIDQRRLSARLKDISLVMTAEAELPVDADTSLVTRIIENLVDNAMRHTPRGGVIETKISVGPEGLEVRVGNSGMAIDPAKRDDLFAKFSQLERGSSLNQGLGLYFCRLAIEAHGGLIWVESTNELPAVFAFRLPMRVTAGMATAASPSRVHQGHVE